MTCRAILTWPDDRLRAKCAPVADVEDVRQLAQDMLETMYDAPGRGLAAPQVGSTARMFVMDATWKTGTPHPWICINPDILDRSPQTVQSTEGCLSLPGATATVPRFETVQMRFTDLSGQTRDIWLDGFEALCAQHEIDHLDGVLTFDHLDAPSRAAFFAEYEEL